MGRLCEKCGTLHSGSRCPSKPTLEEMAEQSRKRTNKMLKFLDKAKKLGKKSKLRFVGKADRQKSSVRLDWVITVGGGYGSFMFRGTEDEAEKMRQEKANWEEAIATKRLATDEERKEHCVQTTDDNTIKKICDLEKQLLDSRQREYPGYKREKAIRCGLEVELKNTKSMLKNCQLELLQLKKKVLKTSQGSAR